MNTELKFYEWCDPLSKMQYVPRSELVKWVTVNLGQPNPAQPNGFLPHSDTPCPSDHPTPVKSGHFSSISVLFGCGMDFKTTLYKIYFVCQVEGNLILLCSQTFVRWHSFKICLFSLLDVTKLDLKTVLLYFENWLFRCHKSMLRSPKLEVPSIFYHFSWPNSVFKGESNIVCKIYSLSIRVREVDVDVN